MASEMRVGDVWLTTFDTIFCVTEVTSEGTYDAVLDEPDSAGYTRNGERIRLTSSGHAAAVPFEEWELLFRP